ncbi:MAG: hypothetical protein GF401_05935 [Chitinivibrionales bacterium]|nr:hypothetical protein [Chitinivibrionales bacterium]
MEPAGQNRRRAIHDTSTIRSLGSREGAVVPGFRSLVAQAKVTPVTMRKAGNFLREKGINERGEGKQLNFK